MLRYILAAIALIPLAACTKQDNNELTWARAALERNPQVKVLSIDATKNTIQVRVIATGETHTLTPGELAAIPIGDLVALTHPPQVAVRNEPTPEPMPVPTPEPVKEALSVPEPVPVAATPTPPSYKVERQDGQVKVTGPGISIESHKPTIQEASAAAITHFDEPMVCDGKRMMHLDGRHIKVDGDAITVRGGCELHITNSEISATGTAISALGSTVHIENSKIHGDSASLDTSATTKLILRNTQFTGLARRDPQTQVQDQGGNTWR